MSSSKKVCKNSNININNKITFQDKVDQRIHKKSCIECIYSDILGKENVESDLLVIKTCTCIIILWNH